MLLRLWVLADFTWSTQTVKKSVDVIFINDGSVLLSCKTNLAFGLIQPRSRLNYLPPRANLITSSVDHPKKTKPVKVSVHTSKQKVSAQSQTQEVAAQTPVTTIVKKQDVNKLITSKEQIMIQYPDVLEGTGKFPGHHTASSLTQALHPNKHLATQYQFILRKASSKK